MHENNLHISLLSKLPPAELAKVLQGLTDEAVVELLHDWRFVARPEQVAPDGDWLVWTYLAGRGAGKTRSGAEWVREKLKAGCGRIALIAPTAAAGREVMVEGVSGAESDHGPGSQRSFSPAPRGRTAPAVRFSMGFLS